MKIAYLLLVHTNPSQVNQLIRSLDNGKNHMFVHVDRKSGIQDEILHNEKVHFVANPLSVKWGDFTLVEATIALCRLAMQFPEEFDYVVFLSGQDYPIKSNEEIEQYFEKHRGKQFFKVRKMPYDDWQHHSGGFDRIRVYFPKQFIDRRHRTWVMRHYWIRLSKALGLTRSIDFFDAYYGCSQWFGASREAMAYIIKFLDDNPDILKFFQNSFIPDEILFNTIIMNSPFKDKVVPHDLRLVEWTKTEENPRIWRTGDIDNLRDSEYLYARKFDIRKDDQVLNRIDSYRRQAARAS